MPIHYRHPRVQDDQEKPGHFLSLNWSSLDGTHLILPVQTPPPPLHPYTWLSHVCLVQAHTCSSYPKGYQARVPCSWQGPH